MLCKRMINTKLAGYLHNIIKLEKLLIFKKVPKFFTKSYPVYLGTQFNVGEGWIIKGRRT